MLQTRHILEKTKDQWVLIFFAFFFTAYFLVGASIYDDYGAHIDETKNLIHGEMTYNFTRDYLQMKDLSGYIEYKYSNHAQEHGAIAELMFTGLHKALGYDDLGQIVRLHHLYTFLWFFTSSVLIAAVAYAITKDFFLTLTTVLAYILHPRIFAYSFFDTTDITLLAAIGASFYSLYRFLSRPGWKNLLLLSLTTSIAINIRLVGLLIPFSLTLAVLLYIMKHKIIKREHILSLTDAEKEQKVKKMLVSFYILLTVLTYIMWPYAWSDISYPIRSVEYTLDTDGIAHNRIYHTATISKSFQIFWQRLFRNTYYMIIITPEVIPVLFLLGIIWASATLLRRNREDFQTFVFCSYSLIFIFVTILLREVINPAGIHRFRHFMFLYPPTVIVCTFGLMLLKKTISRYRKSPAGAIVFGIFVLMMIKPASFMLEQHPTQFIYGNSMVDENKTQLLQTKDQKDKLFEFDNQVKQGMDYLLQNKKGILLVAPKYMWKRAWIYDEKERERLEFVDEPDAQYLIDDTVAYEKTFNDSVIYRLQWDGVTYLKVIDLWRS